MGGHIDFEGLSNTRDLGGMKTRHGWIKSGKFLRSGLLADASDADKKRLSGMAELILDLRTDEEVEEAPDPKIEGAEYVHLPTIDRFTVGVTREKETDDEAILRLMEDTKGSLECMKGVYKRFVKDPFSVEHYGIFIRKMLVHREKAVLWHCTAGKDRAGFGAVIIQEILGVSRDDIFDDYLKTNTYLQQNNEKIFRYYIENGMIAPNVKDGFMCFWGAQSEYLETTYDEIERLYGDFDGFVEKGLKISEDEKERLREMYTV